MKTEELRCPHSEAVKFIAVLSTYNEHVEGQLDMVLNELAIGIEADMDDTPWLEIREGPFTSLRIWLTERNARMLQTALQAALALKP